MDIQSIALRYIDAVLRGDLKSAAPLVAPEQRGVIQAIALGMNDQEKPPPSAVKIGEVRVSGSVAVVSLIGRMCRNTGHSRPDCVHNSNPATTSDLFLLKLAREQGSWFIVYQLPDS